MCALFKNKYRIGSTRYRGYDYSLPGKYSVTICTENKIPYFGNVDNGKMALSDFGQIAKKLWYEISDHFPFVDLDEYIIMPDHIHGIIVIKNHSDRITVEPLHATVLRNQKTIKRTKKTNLQNQKPVFQTQITNSQIQTINHKNQIFKLTNEHMSLISPKHGSLASIVRSYKSAVSKCIHKTDSSFKWQQSFYDNIIRTHSELNQIRQYIIKNPQNWKCDNRNSHHLR